MSAWSCSLVMSCPSTTIEPLVGFSRPPNRLSRVVLPLPLRPMMETNAPWSMASDTPLTAATLMSSEENSLVTSVICNILFTPQHFGWSNFGNKERGKGAADKGDEQGGAESVEYRFPADCSLDVADAVERGAFKAHAHVAFAAVLHER